MLEEANIDVALALAAAVDARDPGTMGHSQNVSDLAVEMAELLDQTPETVGRIRIAGLLHDAGKIGVPDSVLNKKGKLTKAEWDIMARHVELGVKVMGPLDFMKDKIEIIRCHHENWDGSGYPRGIAGGNIPLGARILRLADAFDAVRSERSYRPGFEEAEALKQIEDMSGKWFDPSLVPLLKEAVAKQKAQAVE